MLSARWWTLVVWALAAAGALFWGLKLFVKAPAVPAHTQLAESANLARGDLSRLLGADEVAQAPTLAPEPGLDARFQLIGVVSARSPMAAREGVALIAVDGKPPRAYRVGALVEGQNILQTVNARGATLGPRDGAALVALNLTPPAPPATGVPQPGAGGLPGARPGGQLMPPQPQPQPQPLQQQQQQPQQPQPQPQPQVPGFLPRRMPAPAAVPNDPPPPPGVTPQFSQDASQTR